MSGRSASMSAAPRSALASQVLVHPSGLAQMMVAFCAAGRVASGVGIEAGSDLEIAVLLVEVRGARLAPGDLLVPLVQGRRPRRRAVGLPDCDRAVEPDDGSVGEPEQFVVP